MDMNGPSWWGVFKVIGSVALAALLLVLGVFVYFNLPGQPPRADTLLGVTYSSRYARDLGVDPQKTYIALLDDLKIRHFRIPVYWDLVESRRDSYDFSEIDWQLAEAKKRDADVILSIGQRVPRWPECHIPGWAKSDTALREQELMDFLTVAVERYRDEDTIITWQVENEPFLVFFGECPPFDPDQLDKEIALVRKLDPSRPILTTDSGELSLWFRAARRGDIFGTTMYRMIHKPGVGYVTYPLGPNFFLAKRALAEALTDQKNFIVIELQAEPWASGWIPHVSLEEQFKTMDERKLSDIVTYAKRTQFPEIYLWGAEWWYWLKETKDYPAVWETAKGLFGEAR